MMIDCCGKPLDLSAPRVMGVLNVTPDSFSDGGRYNHVEQACERAMQMADQGAAVIDIGGESTRPGATKVSVTEELDRVLPVIELLQPELSVPISVDTSKAEVMRAAVKAGAGLINDVYALRRAGALEAAADSGAAICLMHMQGEPDTMQAAPDYPQGVVPAVLEFLLDRVKCCEEAGICRDLLIIDPGFGFGKSIDHNLQLLSELSRFADTGIPVLAGLSRKSMMGKLLALDVENRLAPSIALAVMAVERGAKLIRAHDVAETWQALQLYNAVQAH